MPKLQVDRDWASIPMGKTASEFYEKTFLPRIQALTNEVEAIPLVVLVWGPGQKGNDLYQKRLQIRGVLREEGIAAVFSEEIPPVGSPDKWSYKSRELLEAIAADFIVVIQGSSGSTAEVHDFAGYIQQIGRKMLVFVDEKAVSDYSSGGALQELKAIYQNVETFSYPRDIHECHLLGKVERRVSVLRQAKWRLTLT